MPVVKCCPLFQTLIRHFFSHSRLPIEVTNEDPCECSDGLDEKQTIVVTRVDDTDDASEEGISRAFLAKILWGMSDFVEKCGNTDSAENCGNDGR